MEQSQIIILAAVAIGLILLYLESKKKKEQFKIGGVIQNDNRPLPYQAYPSISALNPSAFKGDYGDIVTSPSLPTEPKSLTEQTFMNQDMLTPRDLMPDQTMESLAPADLPNHRFVSVQLKSKYWEPESDLWAIGRSVGIQPVHDYHAMQDVTDFDKYHSIVTGTEYDHDAKFNMNNKSLELRDV